MAFLKSGLYQTSVGMGPTNTFIYVNKDDTMETMEGPAYFPVGTALRQDDTVNIVGSDGANVCYVYTIVANYPIIKPQISTPPAAYVYYTLSTTANGAQDTFSIIGVLPTDHAIAMMQEEVTVEVEAAQCSTDQVQVWYEGSVTNKKIFIVIYRNN